MRGWALVGASATLAAGAADAQSLSGCWTTARPAPVIATICFWGSGGNSFAMRHETGNCSGTAEIVSNLAGTLMWEVPRQEDACEHSGAPERLARRSYWCTLGETAMTCRETVWQDDGSVFVDTDGLVFER